MKGLLLFLLTFSIVHAGAQGRWTVTHNGNERLAATGEDTLANRIVLNYGDLKKCGALVVNYAETPERTDWKRTIILIDAAQNELAKATHNTLKISNRTLRSRTRNMKRLAVYTWAVPADPAVAAAVRVRRVHLCTFIIE